MALHDVTAYRIMALHDTRPAECLTHRHCQLQLTEKFKIIALHSLSLGAVIGHETPSHRFHASSAPSAACVPSVAAPPADVPSSPRSKSTMALSASSRPSLKLLVDDRLQKTHWPFHDLYGLHNWYWYLQSRLASLPPTLTYFSWKLWTAAVFALSSATFSTVLVLSTSLWQSEELFARVESIE